MKADLSQLHSMVAQLEVSILVGNTHEEKADEDGVSYQCMKRIHARAGKPFCCVELRSNKDVYEIAPDRFASEIVVSVLKDIRNSVASARRRVTISYADFETAEVLQINVNSPVFRVFREFFDSGGRLVYSANLIYPGDMLEFDIEFAVEPSA